MAWTRAGGLAFLMTLLAAGNTGAQTAEIIVRTFNNYGVPAGTLAEAQAHAATSLQAAGINVRWMDCWRGDKEPGSAPSRCREEVGGDLVLRLQRAAAAGGHRFVSLGFSLVMPDGVPFLATVYADLAEGVARRAGVAPTPVLGRAIAHEIGHLLLNTNSHADAGLMRAAWSQPELRREHASDWRFQEEEVAKMQAAVASRRVE